MTLTVGSLFSGIGGFDLGLERAGMQVIWQSEIDEFASRVLKKHWPDVPNLGDITKIDWSEIERPDVICGGYPCQPFSTAGKRGGANDKRHLWPAMHNAIRVLRPRYALMENVRGHLSLGFGRVLGDLAEIGYDAEWQIIPAAAVGAPHKRDRVFIVAYPTSEFCNGSNDNTRIGLESQPLSELRNNGGSQFVANTNNTRNRTPKRRINDNRATQIKKRQVFSQFELGRRGAEMANAESKQSNGRQSASDTKQFKQKRLQKQVRTSSSTLADTNSKFVGQYGSSSDVADQSRQWHDQRERQKTNDFGQWWEVEPSVGRVANGVSDRVDRLKGLGNAIVPQVAELVGALVVEHSQN